MYRAHTTDSDRQGEASGILAYECGDFPTERTNGEYDATGPKERRNVGPSAAHDERKEKVANTSIIKIRSTM